VKLTNHPLHNAGLWNAQSRDVNHGRTSHCSDVLYQGTASAVPQTPKTNWALEGV